MLDAKTLQDLWSWDGLRRARAGLISSPRFTQQGLELGAETVVARALTDPSGRTRLDLKKDGERAAALLSVAYYRPIGSKEIRRLRAASEAWSKGDLCLAHIICAHAGLGRLPDGEIAAQRLYMAAKLLAYDLEPAALVGGVGLLASDWPLIKAAADDLEHPGWPKGAPDAQGGEYRPKGEDGENGIVLSANRRAGIGDNKGPPLDGPPKVPETRPSNGTTANVIVQRVVTWLKAEGLFAIAAEGAGAVGAVIATRGAIIVAAVGIGGYWVWQYIKPYYDPPRTLEELQADVSKDRPGTDVHHIVERTQAKDEKFSDEDIEGPDNLVRISRWKHEEITSWYNTPNEDFGWKTPREELQDKSWEKKRTFGINVLRKFGVLK